MDHKTEPLSPQSEALLRRIIKALKDTEPTR